MSTLQQHLDDLGPVPAVRDLATSLAAGTAVESDRQAQYVSLCPSMEGAVAVYLHRTWVSIALPPGRAPEAARLVTGATLDTKTPATTYLHVDAGTLAERPDAVLGIAREAVAWRATGPRSSVGQALTGTAGRHLESCPRCHLELLPSGACGEC